MNNRFSFSFIAAASLAIGLAGAALAHPDARGRSHFKSPPMNPTAVMRAFEGDRQPSEPLQALQGAACVGGVADNFPCSNIDLMSLTPLSTFVSSSGGVSSVSSAANDIWGWADTVSGREFALIGLNDGTGFVEVTDPSAPVYVGKLPTHTVNSSWRDIKVYADHAFIVSEAPDHGMQVFNLSRLVDPDLDPANFPITFSDIPGYNNFGDAHNIAINEATGFAYIVGSNTCSGGLHIVDISNPTSPSFAGCYSADLYTHDVQCVVYNGPDARYVGKEICFAANEDTLTIIDVTDKSNMVQLSQTVYAGRGYTHQVWLDEDHGYLFLDDELDEQALRHDTRTRVLDMADLDAPTIADVYDNLGVAAIDHNQYVRDDRVYQANYRSGLRVLDIVRDGVRDYLMLEEIGFFDVYPSSDSANFNGAWSTYPFLPSGNVLISGIEQGLFVVALNIAAGPDEIGILAPAGSEMVFEVENVDIRAVDADGGATPLVQWRIDAGIDAGVWQATSSAGGDIYSAPWNTAGAAEGVRTLEARMTDDASNKTTTSIQVVVNNLPPNVFFVSPTPGQVSGNVTLIANTDTDGTVVSVTFYDGTEVLGTDSNLSDGASFNWNTKRVSQGNHVLGAQARDNRGEVSTLATVTVEVVGRSGGGGGDPGGGGGGGGGGDKCFRNKEPYCP